MKSFDGDAASKYRLLVTTFHYFEVMGECECQKGGNQEAWNPEWE